MKKLILSLALSAVVLSAFSQSEKYLKTMREKVVAVDTTRDAAALLDIAAAFERIAEAEKTQWLPYYYAALAQVNAGYMSTMSGNSGGDPSAKVDPIVDKATALIDKADGLSKNNAEIYLVKKMIASLHMMGDPQNRYMQDMPMAETALQTAKKLNPEIPRIYLLEGQDKFYTPEQFGGSKSEAKALFELALKKFETYKPASDIDPNWGRRTTAYFLTQAK